MRETAVKRISFLMLYEVYCFYNSLRVAKNSWNDGKVVITVFHFSFSHFILMVLARGVN